VVNPTHANPLFCLSVAFGVIPWPMTRAIRKKTSRPSRLRGESDARQPTRQPNPNLVDQTL